MVDAATGRPVEGVCLISAKPQRFRLPAETCWEMTTSGPSGRVMAEIAEPGWYQMLAFPTDAPGFGAQWVGPHGGAGSQLLAQLVKVDTGQQAKAPTIKLDRAGTVTGRVTSPAGEPVAYAAVSFGDGSTSDVGPGVVYTDEQGRYTMDFLGPYRWPLRFEKYGELGIQWSGQVGNRHLAQTISVQSGQSTTYDYRFKTPTQVTTDPGLATRECLIEGFNLLTGDTVAFLWPEDCSQPVTLPLIGPQWVRFRVSYHEDNQWKERFYETRFVR